MNKTLIKASIASGIGIFANLSTAWAQCDADPTGANCGGGGTEPDPTLSGPGVISLVVLAVFGAIAIARARK